MAAQHPLTHKEGAWDAEDPGAEEAKPEQSTTLSMKSSAIVMAGYMGGCITQFFLVRWSKLHPSEGVKYDNVGATMCIELFKWIMALVLYGIRQKEFLPAKIHREKTYRVALNFAIPAGAYAVYNSLTFYNLERTDPATFQVCMQTRILFTGVMHNMSTDKKLGYWQWWALIILTAGVMIKNLNGLDMGTFFTPVVLSMLFQAFISSVANVSSQYFVKKDLGMDINEQNFYLYSWGVFFLLGFGFLDNPGYYLSGEWLRQMHGIFIAIVVNGALTGLAAAIMIKHMNVIIKGFASAAEVSVTAVLAYLVFGTDLGPQDLVACVLVSLAIYMYNSWK